MTFGMASGITVHSASGQLPPTNMSATFLVGTGEIFFQFLSLALSYLIIKCLNNSMQEL